MVLTLIAEVLAGETRVTPGGVVDMTTACGLDPFTWDGWLDRLHVDEAAKADEIELTGVEAPADEPLGRSI